MKFEVSFAGGMKVDATFGNHTVHTDQPVAVGGTDTALSPFDLFLGSLATCAGLYAMRFCEQREIPTAGLGVTLEPIREPGAKKLGKVRIEVTLPAEFPEKYREAIIRAVDQCAVKKAIADPPEFEVATILPATELAGISN
ncbi:MAG: OsmC family protein [Thermoanaerobaculia bacterium]|jgi:ribosomal protein S12 methylthiotransferase accessory factor